MKRTTAPISAPISYASYETKPSRTQDGPTRAVGRFQIAGDEPAISAKTTESEVSPKDRTSALNSIVCTTGDEADRASTDQNPARDIDLCATVITHFASTRQA